MSTDDRPIVMVDHNSVEFLTNQHAEWAELRKCPVAFDPNYGGYWIVSGHEEVAQVSRDGDTFSSRYEPNAADGVDYLGIVGVPRREGIPPQGIAEVDGPVHSAIRRILNPFLLPPAVEADRTFVEQVATWFLDQRIETGRMDLVLDYTNPVPAVMTMKLMGLPCDNWAHYGEFFHAAVAYGPGSPEFEHANARVPDMMAELLGAAEGRRHDPANDVLTELVNHEIVSVLWNLVAGGLDTTSSLTALALHHLGAHPDLRHQLIDEPGRLGAAVEEYLRYFSVSETLSRTVSRDCELGGQHLGKGDRMLISWISANHDEHVFDHPEQVRFDRAPNPHLAFGVGPHRCIGMHVARSMSQILIRQVLDRIPDYEIDEGSTSFYAPNPSLVGVVALPATFTAGPTRGPATRPF
jgi:cytochrome P450